MQILIYKLFTRENTLESFEIFKRRDDVHRPIINFLCRPTAENH